MRLGPLRAVRDDDAPDCALLRVWDTCAGMLFSAVPIMMNFWFFFSASSCSWTPSDRILPFVRPMIFWRSGLTLVSACRASFTSRTVLLAVYTTEKLLLPCLQVSVNVSSSGSSGSPAVSCGPEGDAEEEASAVDVAEDEEEDDEDAEEEEAASVLAEALGGDWLWSISTSDAAGAWALASGQGARQPSASIAGNNNRAAGTEKKGMKVKTVAKVRGGAHPPLQEYLHRDD